MKKKTSIKSRVFTILPFVAIILAISYLIVRTSFFIVSDYFWYEKTLALLLLLAEIFILIHSIGYFLEIIHVGSDKKSSAMPEGPLPPLTSFPPIAIIVSSFKEPLDVLENTLISFYNLTYPNKYIYFLDDTRYDLPGDDRLKLQDYREEINKLCQRIGVKLFRRKWRGAKAGMINDFLDFLEGNQKEGF